MSNTLLHGVAITLTNVLLKEGAPHVTARDICRVNN